MIEPRADAYGIEADASAFADYLELLTLAGTPLKRAELADLIEDNEWRVRSRELFTTAAGFTSLDDPDEELSEDEVTANLLPDPSVEAADRVFSLAAERQVVLGDLYPFHVGDNEIVLANAIEGRHEAYLSLLAITVAHAYSVVEGQFAENAFEALVADTMRARGLETVDMADASRAATDFRDAVDTAGGILRIVATPEAASSRTFANEEGVDTVSHLWWGDGRPGHWLFIGQATCGKSGTWERKILEPKQQQWMKLLASLVLPQAYLAVPHHVEPEHIYDLSDKCARLVLDRLRLCRFLPVVGDEQRAVLDAVLAEPVWRPS